MPDGDSDYTVTTEWGAFNMHPKRCKHSTTCNHGNTQCSHCTHCTNHPANCEDNDGDDNDGNGGADFCLGGRKILPGTPIHNLVNAIAF